MPKNRGAALVSQLWDVATFSSFLREVRFELIVLIVGHGGKVELIGFSGGM